MDIVLINLVYFDKKQDRTKALFYRASIQAFNINKTQTKKIIAQTEKQLHYRQNNAIWQGKLEGL